MFTAGTIPGRDGWKTSRTPMTDLEDKAAQDPADVDVILARNASGVYCLESEKLTEAAEIGTEDYPRYGDFLSVTRPDGTEAYLECPEGLARLLARSVDPGDTFEIVSQRKDVAGRWRFDLEIKEPVSGLDDAV